MPLSLSDVTCISLLHVVKEAAPECFGSIVELFVPLPQFCTDADLHYVLKGLADHQGPWREYRMLSVVTSTNYPTFKSLHDGDFDLSLISTKNQTSYTVSSPPQQKQ